MVISTEDSIERNFRITNNNAIDMHVGKRVRLRRTLLGMSQEQLGTELNITFQQLQKYERGGNRISASRLWDIGQILDVPISYFFDDMSQDTMKRSPRRIGRGGEVINQHGDQMRDPMARRETLELVRTYYTIEKPIVRKRILEMVKSIATTLSDE
ncbi:MAG: helix-turn-helix domain-containing protein [Alphaproteobacteria bacterium]|nr:helix-turn-helix domain-containing protein [Alphaproteobacteria bacterium]